MKHFKTVLSIVAILLFSSNIQIKAQEMESGNPKISVFPVGNSLPEKFTEYFTGKTYLASLTQNKGNHSLNPVF